MSTASALTLDEYMSAVVDVIVGQPTKYQGKITVSGTLVLHTGHIEIERDRERFQKLYSSGLWTAPNGSTYNFLSVVTAFPNPLTGEANQSMGIWGRDQKLAYAKPGNPDWFGGVNAFRESLSLKPFSIGEAHVAYEIGSNGTPVARDVIDFDRSFGQGNVEVVADARALPVVSASADVIFAKCFPWSTIARVRQSGPGGFRLEAESMIQGPRNEGWLRNCAGSGWNGNIPTSEVEYAQYLRNVNQFIKDVTQEMARVLRPGGLFLAVWSGQGRPRSESEILRLYSEHVKAGEKAGLVVKAIVPGKLKLPNSSNNWGLAFIKPDPSCFEIVKAP